MFSNGISRRPFSCSKILPRAAASALVIALLGSGCAPPESAVQRGNREGILHLSNGDEIKDMDPHTVGGIPEHNVVTSLFEGLVVLNNRTLEPEPGAAERWEISKDGLVYTFHLRPNLRWSNGEPLTARDFLNSHQRVLNPKLSAENARMLFVVRNAEAYYTGRVREFSATGFKALDDRTYQIELQSPAPYLLGMIGYHHIWSPIHLPTLEKFGGQARMATRWTRPGNLVCNGPFLLEEWRLNGYLTLKKNPHYWDASRVRLNGVRFYPISSGDTEERAFRNGQLHVTYDLVRPKLEYYRRERPAVLRQEDYLTVYFYRLNVKRGPLADARVRQALSLAVDREALAKHLLRDGSKPAWLLVPPGVPGYQSPDVPASDPQLARRLLREAGFPDGTGFPKLSIQFNTHEKQRAIAEALQAMWQKELGISFELANAEWKVLLANQRTMDFDISRGSWVGDFLDPKTFLDIWCTGEAKNGTGWSNPRYDALIAAAGKTFDQAERFRCFRQAETILSEEAPVIPFYFYKRVYLLNTSVKGWGSNLQGYYGLKDVFLDPS